MANRRLSDLPEKINIDENDYLLINDVSDPTESPEGTSKKAKKGSIGANYVKLTGVDSQTIQTDINIDGAFVVEGTSTTVGTSISKSSAADTDNVLVVQNGAGSDTFTVNGNGAVSVPGNLSGNTGNFSSTLQASSFNVPGGTSSQFLKADGSLDINAYHTGTLTSGYLSKATGTNSLGNSLIYDNGTNVGIGTTSPGAKLQIGSATYAPNSNLSNNLLQVKSTSGFAYLTIGNGDAVNSTSYIGGASGYTTFGKVSDAGVTTEHARIIDNGNLLIGTTTDSGYKLNVNGSGYFDTGVTSWSSKTTFLEVSDFSRFYDTSSPSDYGDFYYGSGMFYFASTAGVMADSFKTYTGTSSQFLKADGSVDGTAYSPLSSPTFTGTPTAPTATAGTNTTQIATTAFVQNGLATKQNTLTIPTTGVGSDLDPVTYALQDGTILYHSVKWFTPTGEVSTSGTTVTSVGTQFTSAMVGAKLKINGEWRIITGYTSSTVVTVASAYSQNYSGVIAGNWGVYNKSIIISSTGAINFHSTNGATPIGYFGTNSGELVTNAQFQVSNQAAISSTLIRLFKDMPIQWSNGLLYTDTKDLGIRRNSAGVLEIYDGITATGLEANRRDLLVRNAFASKILIGTTTDNGTDKLQVNGSAIASSWKTSGGTSSQKVNGDGSLSVGYKVYTAIISQSGTSAPTATVLENTLGGGISWSYNATGYYGFNKTGAFPSGKVVVFINGGLATTSTYGWARGSDDFLEITSIDNNTTPNNGLINNASIEIRVYN